jgi:hypothetical protein
MRRELVAERLQGMLEPSGALVHISAYTRLGVSGRPHGFPFPSVPAERGRRPRCSRTTERCSPRFPGKVAARSSTKRHGSGSAQAHHQRPCRTRVTRAHAASCCGRDTGGMHATAPRVRPSMDESDSSRAIVPGPGGDQP